MTRRLSWLRVVTAVFALAHAFPAQKHVALFVAQPSIGEAWKGLGATIAIGLYLLPPEVQARTLSRLWQRGRILLSGAGLLLAVVHLVPAADHLPVFLDAPSWADGWRGIGAAIASAWFACPVPSQARLVGVFQRLLSPPALRPPPTTTRIAG